MKQPSRFRDQILLDRKRLHNFVALDNLTSQTPLIEVLTEQKLIRVWVSYDLARECGTYIEVYFNGLVVCVTRYQSGRTVEKVNRPADEPHNKTRRHPRLHKKPKSGAKDRRPRKAKTVSRRAKNARTKRQTRARSASA